MKLLSPGCLRVQYQSFNYVRHEQTALLLSGRMVKTHKKLRAGTEPSERRAWPEWETFKDTAPRYEGWRSLHRTTTGAGQRSERRDLWTHPCTPSSGKRKGEKPQQDSFTPLGWTHPAHYVVMNYTIGLFYSVNAESASHGLPLWFLLLLFIFGIKITSYFALF